MATAIAGKTITNTSWTQISAGNVYIDNPSGSDIYWVAATAQPSIELDLTTAHFVSRGFRDTLALDQPIWARTVSTTITIPVTEF